MSEGELFDDLPDPEVEKPAAHRQSRKAAAEPEETASIFDGETRPGIAGEPARDEPAAEIPAEEPAREEPAPEEFTLEADVVPEPEPEPPPAPELPRAPVTDSGSLGMAMAELRRGRGMTIDDVANETLIKPSYLEALENDSFSELPHMVYVLAYVKKLCTLYGVSASDTEKLVSGLREQLAYEIPEDIDKSVICREQDEENRRKLQQITIGLIAGAVLIVVLLIVGATTLILRSYRSKSAPEEAGTVLSEEWLAANRGRMVLKPTRVKENPPQNRR